LYCWAENACNITLKQDVNPGNVYIIIERQTAKLQGSKTQFLSLAVVAEASCLLIMYRMRRQSCLVYSSAQTTLLNRYITLIVN